MVILIYTIVIRRLSTIFENSNLDLHEITLTCLESVYGYTLKVRTGKLKEMTCSGLGYNLRDSLDLSVTDIKMDSK